MPSGPKASSPPLWFAYGCVDGEDQLRGCRVGAVRIGRAHRVSLDARVAGPVRVVDVEAAVGRVVGMERDAEQPTFAAAPDLRHDVEERRGQQLAVLRRSGCARAARRRTTAASPGGAARRTGLASPETTSARRTACGSPLPLPGRVRGPNMLSPQARVAVSASAGASARLHGAWLRRRRGIARTGRWRIVVGRVDPVLTAASLFGTNACARGTCSDGGRGARRPARGLPRPPYACRP